MRVVGTTTTIPAFFRVDDKLHDDLQSLADQRGRATQAMLARAGVASVRLAGEVNDGSVDRRVARTTATVRFGEPSVNGLAVMQSLLVVTGSRDTLPPADDRLYEAGPFAAGWLVVGRRRRRPRAGRSDLGRCGRVGRRRSVAAPPKVAELRRRYLVHLDDLERQLIDEQLTPRALHHELSRTLRRFAFDTGTAGAPAMSAASLDTAGLRQVATAVRTYEHPQFEELPASDPGVALEIARAVVAGTDLRQQDLGGRR